MNLQIETNKCHHWERSMILCIETYLKKWNSNSSGVAFSKSKSAVPAKCSMICLSKENTLICVCNCLITRIFFRHSRFLNYLLAHIVFLSNLKNYSIGFDNYSISSTKQQVKGSEVHFYMKRNQWEQGYCLLLTFLNISSFSGFFPFYH